MDHDDEDAVSFDLINTYILRKDLSVGTGDEIVILPHIMLMVIFIAKILIISPSIANILQNNLT